MKIRIRTRLFSFKLCFLWIAKVMFHKSRVGYLYSFFIWKKFSYFSRAVGDMESQSCGNQVCWQDMFSQKKTINDGAHIQTTGATLGFWQEGCPTFLNRCFGVNYWVSLIKKIFFCNIYPIFDIIHLWKIV